MNDYTVNLNEIEKNYSLHEFPPNVIVDTTTGCNLNCIQCSHSKITRPKGIMPMNLYKKIVNEIAAEAPDIEFWLVYYGEPLLLKYKLFYMIRYAKEQGLKNCIINTNGMLLDDEMAEMLVDSRIDRIVVGIDGYSKDVYEKIRVNGNRDTVYNNITNLAQKIHDAKSNTIIEVQFIVMEENEHEVEEFFNFWSNHHVHLKIRNRVTWSGGNSDGKNIKHDINRIACGWAMATCPITWQGNVLHCGCDFDARITYGNVNEKTIKEIWKERNKLAQIHLNHEFDKLPMFCQKCNDWQVVGAAYYEESGKLVKKNYK